MRGRENRLTQMQEFSAGNMKAMTTRSYRYDGEDILLEYDGSNVLQVTYTHGPGIDEPLSRTVITAGVSSGVTALLASTADGLRGPLVDDTIVVNGQIYLGFITGTSFLPPVGQPIDSTSSHLPVAPIDVTAAANSGTLTVSLVDTATLSGNAPVYLVLREQATGRVLDSQLLFPARLTATSTAQPGLPTVIASTTVPVSSAVAGSTLYYHQDGLGTVTELTDTNGSVVKAYAYDAYGNLLESPGTVEQPYAYTGREFDAESGLYYYRVRYYDAPTGRFLQKDPISFLGGDANLYTYVGGRPVLFTDALGLKPRSPRHPNYPDYNLPGGYGARVDPFNHKGESSFEIHVCDGRGQEIGIYGPEGWINKHGKGIPTAIPAELETALKGVALEELRARGKFPPKGRADIKGNNWRNHVGKGCPVCGIAGAAIGAGAALADGSSVSEATEAASESFVCPFGCDEAY